MVSKSEYAYNSIKKKIIKGEYNPGEKLVESNLIDEIGVSRNTVRNSLLKLENEGLIDIERNKGAKVKHFTVKEMKDLLDVRKILETYVLKHIIKKITDEDIEELEAIVNEMEKCINNSELKKYSDKNYEFHNYIYNLCSNKEAVDIIKSIKTRLSRYSIKTILIPGRSKSSIKEHKNIFNSIKERNAKKAERSIIKHLESIENTIEEYYTFLS